MKIFSLEHSPLAYGADFVVYPGAILAGLAAMLFYVPMARWPGLALVMLLGLASWTLLEYILHRHVLHGLQPFKRWHEEHHKRPHALIGTSTMASLMLFIVLVLLPMALLFERWTALAATLGIILGYLVYVTIHHGLHHWRASRGSLFYRLKRAHALHHQPGFVGYYGVTNLFWDEIFKSRPSA